MGLNKQNLVEAIAKEVEMTKVDAEKALKATLGAITKELKKGGSVTLIGFGTFSVMKRKARKGKNPRTGEVIKIAAKKVPKFKPGKDLRETVAGKRKKK
jgi:DNA-binding protein HU-beta